MPQSQDHCCETDNQKPRRHASAGLVLRLKKIARRRGFKRGRRPSSGLVRRDALIMKCFFCVGAPFSRAIFHAATPRLVSNPRDANRGEETPPARHTRHTENEPSGLKAPHRQIFPKAAPPASFYDDCSPRTKSTPAIGASPTSLTEPEKALYLAYNQQLSTQQKNKERTY